jgi:ABC-2 type transport system ATP-binding protein
MIHEGKIQACDTPRNLTRSLRATSLVHVELQSATDVAKELEALPGVRKVMTSKTDKGWRAYALRVESQTDIRESVLDLATAKGWRIRELHRQLPTLEDVFVELAAADSGARPFG